ASRGTGYEVMLYSCMHGDPTLFSRTDLVEAAWRIAQPVLDGWAAHPPTDFPNYAAGTWGPKAADDLITRDGRRWFEVLNQEPRTATVRAKTLCDLFVLDKADFCRILRDHHQFAEAIGEVARERYQKSVATEELLAHG